MLPPVLLVGSVHDFSVNAVIYQSQEEEIQALLAPQGLRQTMGWNLPSWQRDSVWSMEQQKSFLESIFLGLGTGTYVVTTIEFDQAGKILPTSGLLIDGQQRLGSIAKFVNNEIAIFDGIYYKDLPSSEQLARFRTVKFPRYEVSGRTPEKELKELYYRLNFGGSEHTYHDLNRLLSES